MKKEEFLQELEALLGDISQGEREEAMQYYRDYFDDAGPEKEADIIEELGSPIRVARIIKEGLSENDGEFSEQGYRDQRFTQGQELGRRRTEEKNPDRADRWQAPNTNGWKIACIILLCVLLFPVIIPIGATVLALFLAGPVVLLCLAVGIAAVALALLISGALVIVTGIVNIFWHPAVGIAVTGVGFLLFAVGMVVMLVTVWCGWKLIPLVIRGIVKLCSFPFRKRREAGQA